MLKQRLWSVLLVGFAAIGLPAAGSLAGVVEVVDTFERGNPNGWDWQLGPTIFSSIQATGGNPGAYLRTNSLVSGAGAWFSAGPDFAGDFVERHVVSVGGDLFSIQGDPNNEVIHIAIVNDGPTSSILDDTIAQFNTGIASPDFSADGWVSFDVAVDVLSETTPPGWQLFSTFGGGGTGNMTWPELMHEVDGIVIGYGVVAGPIAPFQVTRGLDNPRLGLGTPTSPADLDGDGDVDAADLAALLGAWGGPDADLDGDGTTGASDLGILLGAWTA